MLLALDIGNTNIHGGVFRGEELLASWDISNRRGRTSDEFGILLRQIFIERGIDSSKIEGAVISCVVPPVSAVVEEMVEKYFGFVPLFVGPEIDTGLPVLYDDPREVGADRIANAVGGFRKYGGPLIVVDFGTATTFDAVSERGEYLGGAVAPGIKISIEALFKKAARLPRIELVRPLRVVGRNTVSSMQSGIIFGYAGLVETLVNRIMLELGGKAVVVATGGLAELIVHETRVVRVVDQHLTLEGLRIIYQRNSGQGRA